MLHKGRYRRTNLIRELDYRYSEPSAEVSRAMCFFGRWSIIIGNVT